MITVKGVRAGINPAPLGDINILTANFSARNCHPVFLPAFAVNNIVYKLTIVQITLYMSLCIQHNTYPVL